MKAQVSFGGEASDAFVVNHGVKQGCVLVPTIFSLYLPAVLETMNEGFSKGVFIRTKADGLIMQLIRRQIVDRFSSVTDMFGLKINISLTQSLYQPPPKSTERPEMITVHDVYHCITYLGAPSQTPTLQGPVVQSPISA